LLHGGPRNAQDTRTLPQRWDDIGTIIGPWRGAGPTAAAGGPEARPFFFPAVLLRALRRPHKETPPG